MIWGKNVMLLPVCSAGGSRERPKAWFCLTSSSFQRLIERYSGYRAPGDVRGSRLINARSISRRDIAVIMRVQLCTGESGSPPSLLHSITPLLYEDHRHPSYHGHSPA